jgi:hypothetical protein
MRDLARSFSPLRNVEAFDFAGGRIEAMNQMILEEMKTETPTPRSVHGQNILENRATKCLFAAEPLRQGLRTLKRHLYESLAVYLDHWRPDLAGRPFRHRSWCNHYQPNEGVPWHDHAGTPIVAVYSVKGNGGDLIIADPENPNLCHRVTTPPGRLMFMNGGLQHCSTPNFGPSEKRVSLPVNFYFDDIAPKTMA